MAVDPKVKKADIGYNRETCAVKPEVDFNKRVSELLTPLGGAVKKDEAAKPKSAGDKFIAEAMEKGLPKAVKNTVTNALWRAKTGIGLNPEVAKALSGPMKAAALMFISNPSLANTVAGAELLMQLMSNVEGFVGLAKNE